MTTDAQSTELSRLVQGGQAIVRIENESMQQLAIQRPRPALPAIIKEAEAELEAVPEFASTAFYVLPFRERSDDPDAKIVKIEGLSIKAAQALRRHYRNIASATRTIDETERDVVVQGAAIDLETNTRAAKEKNVSKFIIDKRTKQEKILRSDRLQMAIDAGKSKAERNAILAILPEALKLTYFRRAKEIAGRRMGAPEGKKAAPLAERREMAIRKFSELGVSEEKLLSYLKIAKREQMTEEQIGELIGVYNSISDNEMAIDEIFTVEKKAEQPTAGEALLDGMLGATPPPEMPEDGSTPTHNGHTDLTPEQKARGEQMMARQHLEEEFEAKMKKLTPRYPGRLTDGETKFLAEVCMNFWKVGNVHEVFRIEQVQFIEIGLAKFHKMADDILARRAKR